MSEMRQLSDLHSYLTPVPGKDGMWGSAGGLALRDSLARGSAAGVMDLIKSMDVHGVAIALREAGFDVDHQSIQGGRATVFASVKADLEEALEARVNGFELQSWRTRSRSGANDLAFGEKGIHSDELTFKANEFDGDVQAARAIQRVMRAGNIYVDVLGEQMHTERASLRLIAGQGLKQGVQGFGFDGLPGKYQVPLSLVDVVDLHREAAQSVAIDSARAGLAAWAAGEKVSELSDWVPDSVQRLLHGTVSLAAAQAVVQAIDGGSIARHASEIGAHSITGLLGAQGLDVNAPTIAEQAEELGLKVKDPERTRGQYFGTVVAIDHRAALVKYTRTEAIELPFAALSKAQDKPAMGEALRVSFKNGAMNVGSPARQAHKTVSR
jgi:hypothetical protein